MLDRRAGLSWALYLSLMTITEAPARRGSSLILDGTLGSFRNRGVTLFRDDNEEVSLSDEMTSILKRWSATYRKPPVLWRETIKELGFYSKARYKHRDRIVSLSQWEVMCTFLSLLFPSLAIIAQQLSQALLLSILLFSSSLGYKLVYNTSQKQLVPLNHT